MEWLKRLLGRKPRTPQQSKLIGKLTITPGEEKIGAWLREHPPKEEPPPSFIISPEIPSMRPPPNPAHQIRRSFHAPPASKPIWPYLLSAFTGLAFLAVAFYAYLYK